MTERLHPNVRIPPVTRHDFVPALTDMLRNAVYAINEMLARWFKKRVLSVSMTADANYTLTDNEYSGDILVVTSTATLTVTRDLIAPVISGLVLAVTNSTTGGQSLRVIGASGTGITIANAKSAVVYCDATNWVRLTGDA